MDTATLEQLLVLFPSNTQQQCSSHLTPLSTSMLIVRGFPINNSKFAENPHSHDLHSLSLSIVNNFLPALPPNFNPQVSSDDTDGKPARNRRSK